MRLRFFPTAAVAVVAGFLVISSANLSSAQTDDGLAPLPPSSTIAEPTLPVVQPTRAPVPQPVAVIVKGRGFGHGRGLGQWGAYGYAIEKNWTYRQILEHFYGGTVVGAVSPLSAIGVRLTALDDKALVVYQPKGRLFTAIDGQVGFTLPPGFEGAQSAIVTGDPLNSGAAIPVVAGVAVPQTPSTIAATTGNRADPPLLTGEPAAVKVELTKAGIVVSFGASCSGPWVARPPIVTRSLTVSSGPPDPAANPDHPDEMLQVCEGKSRRVYRGELLATSGNPGQRAVNLVGLDAYLRGVVPREILPSWGDQGMAALRAQAVAARSYAAAEKRNGFSNTCDTISCQVYKGRGLATATSFQSLEDSRTDRAIAETANEIRVEPRTGKPIRTEFSASTGGYTAGGEFPAVPDDGDAIAANPNRSWTVRLPAARFANAKLGAFREAKVMTRDGKGDDGGRVAKLQLIYAKGSTNLTGNQLMSRFGLRSSWFDLMTEMTGQPTVPLGDTVPPDGVGEALTGDAGGPVAVGQVVREVDAPAGSSAASTTSKATVKKTSTNTKSTKVPRTPVRATTTIVLAVAVGADPVRVVAGSATPVGSPTTAPKLVTRKKKK